MQNSYKMNRRPASMALAMAFKGSEATRVAPSRRPSDHSSSRRIMSATSPGLFFVTEPSVKKAPAETFRFGETLLLLLLLLFFLLLLLLLLISFMLRLYILLYYTYFILYIRVICMCV